MWWRILLSGLAAVLNGSWTLNALADVQQSTYDITVTAHAAGDAMQAGRLSGILPQLSGSQAGVLGGIALLIVSLLGLLIRIWWQCRRQIKEQS
ncbi:cell surface protein [Lactobacillus sp. CBA3605]|uniref:cell surface protein n=1 Tax=Lactobacillus sp. CBA3605 TaxID=2099788 RepID=UPI000CFBACF8|nr:cell surface protein [Lactobacillus sp. CBA3605]AVK61424.1 cell surface protein [Lactobacillus sp. CBA3605]